MLWSTEAWTSQAQKEIKRARRTYALDRAEGRASQNDDRKRTSEAHSHSGNSKREGQIRTAKERGRGRALTSWKAQREELVRIARNREQARSTHILESASAGISQDGERKQGREANSLARRCRRGNMS
jgi:hypothetical protein